MAKQVKGALVKSKINHDSMWITCKFSSGGHFKYRITRYDSTLTLALGKNDHESNIMMKIFNDWVNKYGKKSYGDMFKKLEGLCNLCTNGYMLIDLMNEKKVKYYAETTKSN